MKNNSAGGRGPDSHHAGKGRRRTVKAKKKKIKPGEKEGKEEEKNGGKRQRRFTQSKPLPKKNSEKPREVLDSKTQQILEEEKEILHRTEGVAGRRAGELVVTEPCVVKPAKTGAEFKG